MDRCFYIITDLYDQSCKAIDNIAKEKTKDPIQIAHDEILKQKISNKKNLEKINTEVINKIKEAAEYALESPFPKDEDLYKDVYI